jgi:diguanylate cyclase (GGDEF)-like protein
VRIQPKFYLATAVLLATTVAVSAAALRGVSVVNGQSSILYHDNVRTTQLTATFRNNVDQVNELVLRIALEQNPTERAVLRSQLEEQLIPEVNRTIKALLAVHAGDPAGERAHVAQIVPAWAAIERSLRPSGVSVRARVQTTFAERRVAGLFSPLDALVGNLEHHEAVDGVDTYRNVQTTYRSTVWLIIASCIAALLASIATAIWLGRQIVPRTLSYSRLAASVADGELTQRVAAHGLDELGDLGRTLNSMVDRQQADRAYDQTQAEFSDAMQLAETESEAHELLKHHLERSLARSNVVVLNRNNSEDRLEPRTPLPPDSPLAQPLRDSSPRSCLAVRFARTHHTVPESPALLECQICGSQGAEATCQPLLVSGNVIGSVLVQHPEPLAGSETRRLRNSVAQAAPVIANLRTLAIAELRAATDALTGLPNNRAVQDTIKRMVAQAARSGAPLTVALLDLDHFKEINDTHGHGPGDEVLAAVAATLRASIREGDFAGRYGGEEFILLFPDTDIAGGRVAAEAIRAAIESTTTATAVGSVTASIGLASMPEHALDAAALIRLSDRALYTAKSRGRNRVETIQLLHSPPKEQDAA